MAPCSSTLAVLAACVLALSPVQCNVVPSSNTSLVTTFVDADTYSAATKATGTNGSTDSAMNGVTQLFTIFVDLNDAPSEGARLRAMINRVASAAQRSAVLRPTVRFAFVDVSGGGDKKHKAKWVETVGFLGKLKLPHAKLVTHGGRHARDIDTAKVDLESASDTLTWVLGQQPLRELHSAHEILSFWAEHPASAIACFEDSGQARKSELGLAYMTLFEKAALANCIPMARCANATACELMGMKGKGSDEEGAWPWWGVFKRVAGTSGKDGESDAGGSAEQAVKLHRLPNKLLDPLRPRRQAATPTDNQRVLDFLRDVRRRPRHPRGPKPAALYRRDGTSASKELRDWDQFGGLSLYIIVPKAGAGVDALVQHYMHAFAPLATRLRTQLIVQTRWHRESPALMRELSIKDTELPAVVLVNKTRWSFSVYEHEKKMRVVSNGVRFQRGAVFKLADQPQELLSRWGAESGSITSMAKADHEPFATAALNELAPTLLGISGHDESREQHPAPHELAHVRAGVLLRFIEAAYANAGGNVDVGSRLQYYVHGRGMSALTTTLSEQSNSTNTNQIPPLTVDTFDELVIQSCPDDILVFVARGEDCATEESGMWTNAAGCAYAKRKFEHFSNTASRLFVEHNTSGLRMYTIDISRHRPDFAFVQHPNYMPDDAAADEVDPYHSPSFWFFRGGDGCMQVEAASGVKAEPKHVNVDSGRWKRQHFLHVNALGPTVTMRLLHDLGGQMRVPKKYHELHRLGEKDPLDWHPGKMGRRKKEREMEMERRAVRAAAQEKQQRKEKKEEALKSLFLEGTEDAVADGSSGEQQHVAISPTSDATAVLNEPSEARWNERYDGIAFEDI